MEPVWVLLLPVTSVLAHVVDAALGTTVLKFNRAFWIGISGRDFSRASASSHGILMPLKRLDHL